MFMGKGDMRTRRGKTNRGSHGKRRPKGKKG
jgi:ribosomal small subunit protein bTHX